MGNQLLDRYEAIFGELACFLARTWPENCPGILFLADTDGCLLHTHPFPTESAESPGIVGRLPSDAVSRLNDTKQPYFHEDAALVYGVVPIVENQLAVGALGVMLQRGHLRFDLFSYLRNVMPMVELAKQQHIRRIAGEIVTRASQAKGSKNIVRSLLKQVVRMSHKGTGGAAKLDQLGRPMPETICTSGEQSDQRLLAELLTRFADVVRDTKAVNQQTTLFVPLWYQDSPFYALVFHIPQQQAEIGNEYDDWDASLLQEVAQRFENILYHAIQADEMRKETRKKDLLYQFTRKIHSSIDVHTVLEESMNILRQLYPSFSVELYLTVETETTLPVKPLSIQTDEDEFQIRNQAYLEGRLVVKRQQLAQLFSLTVAAPLLGKQGIYGVVQLAASQAVNLSREETEYIAILAENAGIAFENAQLYQQSRKLVRELRMINRMAQQLNRTLNLPAILQFVQQMLEESFSAEYCAILLRDPDEKKMIVLSSTQAEHVGRKLTWESEPLAGIVEKRQAVLHAYPREETRLPLISFASMMGVPLLRDAEVSGVLFVCDSRTHVFSFDDYQLLDLMGQHASLAITNALLHNEMKRMVITDALTGLFTRRYLDEQVQQLLNRDQSGALLLIDIDYFKIINDTYGHQVGDEVLLQVADLVKGSIRPGDIAARWGGEELAVYLPEGSLGEAQRIAETIRKDVEAMTNPQVTISCGLAGWNRHEAGAAFEVNDLFYQADTALYAAKNKGRNRIC
ncbi:diguanylate cyclase domain-containing protein [Brevibacillus fulvus]|uniref:Diguanylate cyclase (GGDEF)-like protein n=1 Tax=Brevibacillus fulvus TaxID=1125967 RepID=A0A938Y401_9BACL|nr:diguanylate cyclase (GGDEF)-like protein [Brevibacillus fulvus]